MGVSRRLFLASGLASLTACTLGKHIEVGQNRKVLVLGAGASGLGAAQMLAEYGFDVTVIEGRERLGGRIWTDNSFGHAVDLGASWIHGAMGNPVRKLTKQWNIETTATDYMNVYVADHDGRALSRDGVNTTFSRWETWLEETEAYARKQSADVSMAEALAESGKQFNFTELEQRFMVWRNHGMESEFAEDLTKLSARGDNEEGAFLGGDRLFPKGYGQFVEGLAKDLDIKLGEKVGSVTQDADGVEVVTDSATYAAEFVIVTFSLGVLKSGTVTFTPSLPERKTLAIERLGMGTLNKVAVKFPKVFWPQGHDFFGRLLPKISGRELSVFLDWSHITGDPTVIAFSGGSLARGLEKTVDDAELGERVREAFAAMLNKTVPEPTHVKVTRWTSDPFARGSYSNLPVGVSGSEYDVMAEPFDRVLFAGEATNRKHPATVHGALLSGVREAERLLSLV